jgi:hypothetical protein
MPATLAHSRRVQAHRSLREMESISGSQDVTFLDQPWYYEADDALSQITASTSRSKRDDSEPVSAMSQSENACEDSQQTLFQFVKTYSVRHICSNRKSCMFFANCILASYHSSRDRVHVPLRGRRSPTLPPRPHIRNTLHSYATHTSTILKSRP